MSNAQARMVDGATLAYGDDGDRAPLLFVHGWPFDGAQWLPQVAAFAGERRVLTPDLVGAGASAPVGRTTLDDHVDDLMHLLDGLEIRQVALIGLSMGGYIALAFARRFQARLAALILADTRAEADTPEQRDGRARMAAQVRTDGVAALLPTLLPRLMAPAAATSVRDAVADMIRRQPVDGVVAALSAMAARPEATAGLAGIAVPTLVLVGTEDVITPPDAAATLAAGIPGAQHVLIPGAGHLSNLEEPGAFNAAMRAFLRANGTGP